MASSSVQQEQESTELQNGSTYLNTGSPEHIGVGTLEPTPSNLDSSWSLLTNAGSFERDPDAESIASSRSTGFSAVDMELPETCGTTIDNQAGNDVTSCKTSSLSLRLANIDSFERDLDAVSIASSTGFSVVEMELPTSHGSASSDHQVIEDYVASSESSPPHCNRLTTDFCEENNRESNICCGKERIEVPSSDSGYDDVSKSSMDTLSQVKECNKLYTRVEEEGIVVEELHTTPDRRAVVGTVIVHNECYKKSVGARYTVNGWENYSDSTAQWVETIEEGRFDRFKVCVDLPLDQRENSQVMEVAFYFGHHWDNNGGKNYSVPL